MSISEGKNQELNKKIKEDDIEKKQNSQESWNGSELLEIDDEISSDFLKKREKIILDIRSKIERHPVDFYKSNIEELFINSEILDLAEEYGYGDVLKVLKDEFFHALEHDDDFDKKLNIVKIAGFEDGPDNKDLEEYRNKIEKSFEDSLSLGFLTEASSRLLRKYPEVRTLDYFNNLEKSFSLFLSVNKKKVDEIFRDRNIEISHNGNNKVKEININNDKVIFTGIDFKKAKINFESERYQKIKKKIENLVDANKEAALIKLSSLASFLSEAASNSPEMGIIPGAKRKRSHKNLDNKIRETMAMINKDIKEIEGSDCRNSGHDCSNRFIKIFHFFKTNLETTSKDLSNDGRAQYNKILKKFNILLSELSEKGKENHEAKKVDLHIGQESANLKGTLTLPLNVDNFSDFKEFGDKIKQNLLNKPFDRKELTILIEKMKKVFGEMTKVFEPEDLKRYDYFKDLKRRFSECCDEAGMSSSKKREISSRFF